MTPDYKEFKAIFKPHRTDDLRDGMEKFIGKTLTFEYGFTEGEVVYMCKEFGFPYWVPESDLDREI